MTRVAHNDLSISTTYEGDIDDGDNDHLMNPLSHEHEKTALILSSQVTGCVHLFHILFPSVSCNFFFDTANLFVHLQVLSPLFLV